MDWFPQPFSTTGVQNRAPPPFCHSHNPSITQDAESWEGTVAGQWGMGCLQSAELPVTGTVEAGLGESCREDSGQPLEVVVRGSLQW